jgi:hypothetical protein
MGAVRDLISVSTGGVKMFRALCGRGVIRGSATSFRACRILSGLPTRMPDDVRSRPAAPTECVSMLVRRATTRRAARRLVAAESTGRECCNGIHELVTTR